MLPMQKISQPDEHFDIYYDVNETLFERIRELMDRQTDISALRAIRDHVVRAVAEMENITPERVYSDLTEIRAA